MRTLETLIRVQKRQLDQLRRELAGLEQLAIDLRQQAADLETEVVQQQGLARTTAEGAFAYPGYARTVIARRGKVAASIADVDVRVAAMRERVAESFQELKRYDIVLSNRRLQARIEADRREQLLLDEMGLEAHRRRHA
ncbi:MAG: flagellar FliJ family protein [Alphaproteobacteria bacterium]|nr:flagellar FliJ family protein [Alphaproteobacteria bacterium]